MGLAYHSNCCYSRGLRFAWGRCRTHTAHLSRPEDGRRSKSRAPQAAPLVLTPRPFLPAPCVAAGALQVQEKAPGPEMHVLAVGSLGRDTLEGLTRALGGPRLNLPWLRSGGADM